ncbi:hypothetical protein [Nonomuraea sp. NPDC049784]|uniref:hypothetical protein n=1 Tax=Nonomuraea sp. NPDC049784 TaxID=3154361 RepID=UPI0033E7EF16
MKGAFAPARSSDRAIAYGQSKTANRAIASGYVFKTPQQGAATSVLPATWPPPACGRHPAT